MRKIAEEPRFFEIFGALLKICPGALQSLIWHRLFVHSRVPLLRDRRNFFKRDQRRRPVFNNFIIFSKFSFTQNFQKIFRHFPRKYSLKFFWLEEISGELKPGWWDFATRSDLRLRPWTCRYDKLIILIITIFESFQVIFVFKFDTKRVFSSKKNSGAGSALKEGYFGTSK